MLKRAILQFLTMVRFLALYIFKLKKKHDRQFEKMDDGFLRLYSGDPLQVPVADLNVHTDGLKIGPISKSL